MDGWRERSCVCVSERRREKVYICRKRVRLKEEKQRDRVGIEREKKIGR